jgi:hypothetical protein
VLPSAAVKEIKVSYEEGALESEMFKTVRAFLRTCLESDLPDAASLSRWHLHKSDSGIPPMEIGGLFKSNLQTPTNGA